MTRGATVRLVVLLLMPGMLWALPCSAPPAPPPAPFGGPNGAVPPGTRTPYDLPEPPPEDAPPDGPETPPPENPQPPGPETPAPRGPETPPDGPTPSGPETPPDTPGPTTRPDGVRSRPSRTGVGVDSWRVWWEFNKTHLLGLRHVRMQAGPITGRLASDKVDPLGDNRGKIREALGAIAVDRKADRRIREAACVALGRLGHEEDVDHVLDPLRDESERESVRAAAALGLALFPPFERMETREKVRRQLEWLFGGAGTPQRLREYALIATGLRAYNDQALALALAARCEGTFGTWDEGAALAFALGLSGEALLLPELLTAASKGRLCDGNMHDVGRSHAVLSLGRTGSPVAVEPLLKILDSRRTGRETRRSAVLALGRLLREADLTPEQTKPVAKELVHLLDTHPDPLVKGYCAVALGAARPPLEVATLRSTFVRRSEPTAKVYVALALGLAARDMPDEEARPIRQVLGTELAKSREKEQTSALMVALGIARAREAAPMLIEYLRDERAAAPVRAAAAEALGLGGISSPEIIEALREGLHSSSEHLINGSAAAIGMLGDRAGAVEILSVLENTKSGHLHSHLAFHVGFLGHPSAAVPLLRLVTDKTAPDSRRADAAAALGLLGDLRERDLLFELEAWFNYFATTTVTRELVMLE